MTYKDKGSYESSPPCTGFADTMHYVHLEDTVTLNVRSPPPEIHESIVARILVAVRVLMGGG